MRRKKTEKKETLATLETGELHIQPVQEDESIKGTVGYDLRQAREIKKLSIEEIAASLKIKPCYLKALELSDYNDFPGQAYALGFLRTYADFLGLDTQSLLARYRQERSFIKPEKMDMPIQQTQPLPYARYFIWSLFIIAFIWVFWYFLTYSQVSETPLKQITSTKIEEKKEETPKVEELPSPVTEENKDALQQDAKKEEVKEVKKAESEPPKNESRIKLVATQDVWLEISEEDSLVLSRTLKKGESYEVPLKSENMSLKTGNAGGVDVFVDGKKVKPLGPSGAVRSNISLAPDKLKNR